MSRIIITILCSILLISYGICISPNDVINKLIDAKIIGDVINYSDGTVCEVQFATVSVDLGNSITPTEAKFNPNVMYDANNSQCYIIIMVDPDASKAKPFYGQYLHWLVTNIKGQNISQGIDSAPYIGPAPPAGTGFHRYIFLIYKQKSRINSLIPLSERHKFSTQKFADEYNLGDPIAVNYFISKFEE